VEWGAAYFSRTKRVSPENHTMTTREANFFMKVLRNKRRACYTAVQKSPQSAPCIRCARGCRRCWGALRHFSGNVSGRPCQDKEVGNGIVFGESRTRFALALLRYTSHGFQSQGRPIAKPLFAGFTFCRQMKIFVGTTSMSRWDWPLDSFESKGERERESSNFAKKKTTAWKNGKPMCQRQTSSIFTL